MFTLYSRSSIIITGTTKHIAQDEPKERIEDGQKIHHQINH